MDALPLIGESLTAWAKDDEGVQIYQTYAEDLFTIIYLYMVAYGEDVKTHSKMIRMSLMD